MFTLVVSEEPVHVDPDRGGQKLAHPVVSPAKMDGHGPRTRRHNGAVGTLLFPLPLSTVQGESAKELLLEVVDNIVALDEGER